MKSSTFFATIQAAGLSLLMLLVAAPTTAFSASFTLYTGDPINDRADFLTDLGLTLTLTQDFEGFAHETNLDGVDFLPGISVTSNLANVFAFDSVAIGVVLAISPRQAGIDAFYDINIDEVYRAVGFDIAAFNPASPGPGIMDVFFDDGTNTSVQIFPLNATEEDPVFFGVIASTPIVRIRWTEGPEVVVERNEETALDNFVVSEVVDIDGDGIPDAVELFGVFDSAGNLVADMAALGADPCRKTVAVEIDFMDGALDGHTHKPKVDAIAELIDAFNNAPVLAVSPCPYAGFGFPTQPSGVNLVIDIDDPVPEAAELSFGRGFETTKAGNFEAARAPYFHYNLWVHDLFVGRSISGVGELNGDDFIVSLGSWTDQVGTTRHQSGTFMHELGHNLGLRHGGSGTVNRKPNYLSVMNYRFSFGIIDAATITDSIDYSRSALPTLTESTLDENVGIGDGTLLTSWNDLNFNFHTGRGDGPLDWTGNDFDDDTGVAVDINGDSHCVLPGSNGSLDTTEALDDVIISGVIIVDGPNFTCDTAAVGDDEQRRAVGQVQPTLLTGFDDWSNLDYIFTDDPNFAPGIHFTHLDDEPPITFEEAQIIEKLYHMQPLAVLELVRNNLQDIVDGDPLTPLAEALEDVIAKLDDAIFELDQTPPDNRRALLAIERAAHDLERALKGGLLDDAQGTQFLTQLAVYAARQLAADAITAAIAVGGNPNKIAKAQLALEDGDALRTAGSFAKAVDKYREALVKAEKA